jgi:hypothetical protein
MCIYLQRWALASVAINFMLVGTVEALLALAAFLMGAYRFRHMATGGE